MAIVSYDPSTGGPSSAAQMSSLVANDKVTSSRNLADYNNTYGRNRQQYLGLNASGQQTGFGQKAQLASSLGASGQFGSSAGNYQQGEQGLQFQNQQTDLTTAFNRVQTDIKRQEVFAAMGLVL